MRVDYDRDANAVYIHLADKPYGYGRDLDHERRIDYAADGTPIGVELTCARGGVNIDNLPVRDEISDILRKLGIPVYA